MSEFTCVLPNHGCRRICRLTFPISIDRSTRICEHQCTNRVVVIIWKGQPEEEITQELGPSRCLDSTDKIYLVKYRVFMVKCKKWPILVLRCKSKSYIIQTGKLFLGACNTGRVKSTNRKLRTLSYWFWRNYYLDIFLVIYLFILLIFRAFSPTTDAIRSS